MSLIRGGHESKFRIFLDIKKKKKTKLLKVWKQNSGFYKMEGA